MYGILHLHLYDKILLDGIGQLQPGAQVQPKRTVIRPRGGGDAPDPVSVTAPVERVEPTGAETVVLLDFARHRVFGRIAPDAAVPVGAPATFSVDTRKICLFDPETERLIA